MVTEDQGYIISVQSFREQYKWEKTIFKIYPMLIAGGEDVYFSKDEHEQELQQVLKNQIY